MKSFDVGKIRLEGDKKVVTIRKKNRKLLAGDFVKIIKIEEDE